MNLRDKEKSKIKSAKGPLKKLLNNRVEQLLKEARELDRGEKRDAKIDIANELEDYFLNEIENICNDNNNKQTFEDK